MQTIIFMWLAGHVSVSNVCIITTWTTHRELKCSLEPQANIGITWFIREDGYAAEHPQ